jgi:hypothetical protein
LKHALVRQPTAIVWTPEMETAAAVEQMKVDDTSKVAH